jgi:hypothetical protein
LLAAKFLDYAIRNACTIKYRIAGGAEIDNAPLTQVEDSAVLPLRGWHSKNRRGASRGEHHILSKSVMERS